MRYDYKVTELLLKPTLQNLHMQVESCPFKNNHVGDSHPVITARAEAWSFLPNENASSLESKSEICKWIQLCSPSSVE